MVQGTHTKIYSYQPLVATCADTTYVRNILRQEVSVSQTQAAEIYENMSIEQLECLIKSIESGAIEPAADHAGGNAKIIAFRQVKNNDSDNLTVTEIGNRLDLAQASLQGIKAVLADKKTREEYSRRVKEHEIACNDLATSETTAIQATMRADELQRSITQFQAKVDRANLDVERAENVLNEARAALERSVASREQLIAERNRVQEEATNALRESHASVASADVAAFRAMALGSSAGKFLLEAEERAATQEMEAAMDRAEFLSNKGLSYDALTQFVGRVINRFKFSVNRSA